MSGTITITERYIRKYDRQSEGRIMLVTGSAAGITETDPVFTAWRDDRSAYSVPGRASGTTGALADIVAGSNGVLRRSGTGNLAFGTLVTDNIGDLQITYAKIQNVSATSRVLGRITTGAGVVEELTGANVRTIADVAQKQSSTTDTTSGRGLIVGAFGLGAALAYNNIDDDRGVGRIYTGYGETHGSATPGTNPYPGFSGAFGSLHTGHSSSSMSQIVLDALNSSPEIKYRGYSTSWGDWRRVVSTADSAMGIGKIPFFNSSTQNYLSTETNFHWDNTNKRLGIGTSDPSHQISSLKDTSAAHMVLQREGTSTGMYTGIDFAVTSAAQMTANGYRKGALYFERTASNARGSIHIAVNNADSADNVSLTDAVVTITRDGNVGIGTTTPAHTLDVSGIGRFVGNLFADADVGEIGYTGAGFMDSGWRYVNANQRLVIDNLTVRKQMKVFEILIEQLRAQRGTVVISPGDARIEAVNGNTVTVDTGDGRFPLSVEVNDLLRCQRWSGDGTKYYIIRVTSVTANTFDFAAFHGSDNPAPGDELAVIGNTSDSSRQGLLWLTASAENSPHLAIYDGINSEVMAGKEKLIAGKLWSGLDVDLEPSGYGLFSDNVFLKGKMVITAGSGYNNFDDKPIWPSDDDLTAYWSFDEGSGNIVKDNIGNIDGDNDGAIYIQGISGKGLYFDKNSVDLGLHDINTVLSGGGIITISGWIHPDSLADRNFIFVNHIHGTSFGILVEVNADNKISVGGRSATADSYRSVASNLAIEADKSYFVTGILNFTSGRIDIYINGNYDNGSSVSWSQTVYTPDTATREAFIGNHALADRDFHGMIDEIRIYKRELSLSEIRGLYYQVKSGETVTSIIQGGVITSGKIVLKDQSDTEKAGITGAGSETDIALWSGATYANRANADFRVDYNGKLFATGADLEGKISANEGNIAGWVIDQELIYKGSNSDGERVEIDSENQRFRFLIDGIPRSIFSAKSLTSFTSLVTPIDSGTWYPALDHQHSSKSFLFENISSAVFSATQSSCELKVKISYVANINSETINANYKATVYLTKGGLIVDEIGSINELFVTTDSRLITLPRFSIINEDDYQIRYDVEINDYSEDEHGSPSPGTFTTGGSGTDHRIEWKVNHNYETVIGRNGLYSFFGKDRFMYMNSESFEFLPMGVRYHFGLKGNIRLMSAGSDYALGADGCAIDMHGDIMKIEGQDIRLTNIPTSSSGLSVGSIYIQNGYLRIVQ